MANHAPLTKKILDNAPTLKLAVIARGGPTNANIKAATQNGVFVCNAPGRNATATAEHTMSLILAVLRRLPETHTALAQGQWRGDYYEYDRYGLELEDSAAGLIGCGAIGSRVARMLRGFGCQVLVYDPYTKPETLGDLAQNVELDELLSRSRIVSLHARATMPETQGMIGAKQLAAMPAGSVLINCARGTLVDYDAVCDALDSNHLWGRRLRRVSGRADPGGFAPPDNSAHRDDASHCGRQQADRRESRSDRRWRGSPLPSE